MTKTTALLGLRVEPMMEPGEDWPTYHLHGPRGAHYKLVRNGVKPELVYAVNMRPARRGWSKGLVGHRVDIGGYSYFSDKGGKLRPVVA